MVAKVLAQRLQERPGVPLACLPFTPPLVPKLDERVLHLRLRNRFLMEFAILNDGQEISGIL